LDRDYPSRDSVFEPMRSKSGDYLVVPGLSASEMIRVNIDSNETLTDEARSALESLLQRLVDENVLDPPRTDLPNTQKS
jgi:hypothetical protein